MKNNFIYMLLLSGAMLSSCGNSNQNSAAHVDSSANSPESIDTTLSKTDKAVDLDTVDLAFFENAAYGGMVEVESSNKILQSTKDNNVKALANMMVADHTVANAELKSLATLKGYRLPQTLPDSKMKAIGKMDELKEEGRDEYYVQLMTEEHKNAVDLFSQAGKSKDKDIAKFANQLLPKLKAHYQHTLQVDTLLKMPKANQGDDPSKISNRKKN